MKCVSVNIVRDGSYAAQIGLVPRDLIYKVNGACVSDPQYVTSSISGGYAVFTIIRDSEMFDVTVESTSLGVVLGEIEFDDKQFANDRAIASVILSTAQTIPGMQISRALGVVGAQCIYGVNALADLAAGIREAVGGRSKGLQERLAEARAEICKELRQEAHRIGGNGVVAISFEHSEIGDKGGFMLMVAATGTAVICS